MNGCQSSPSLRRRFSLLILTVVFALTLTLLLAVVGYAARANVWRATEFQIQNLDDEEALITARFYAPDGFEVLSFTDTIAPGMSAYYQPEFSHGLPDTFTGTLVVESEQNIAGAVVHFASPTPAHHNGVTVYEMFDEAELSTSAYAPLVEKDNGGFSSRMGISNLSDVGATVNVEFHGPLGDVLFIRSEDVGPWGMIEVDVGAIGELPRGFVGSAVVQADRPILVEVSRFNGKALASYSSPPEGDSELVAPLVAGVLPGVVTSTVATQNASDQPTTVAQRYDVDCETCPCRIVNLAPGGSDFSRVEPSDTFYGPFAEWVEDTGQCQGPWCPGTVYRDFMIEPDTIRVELGLDVARDKDVDLFLIYDADDNGNVEEGVDILVASSVNPAGVNERISYSYPFPGRYFAALNGYDVGAGAFIDWWYSLAAPRPRPLYIFNDDERPVASVVTVESAYPSEAGSATYAAFDVGRLGNRAAAPLVYGGYEGWYTRIWVQNLGPAPATVGLTYTLLISPGTSVFPANKQVVEPGQAVAFSPPPTPHASAIAWADQPIAMLIEGYNDSLAMEDSRFYYRGTPYGPPLARFVTNSPVELGRTVYFENLSVAVPPVSYQWNFGPSGVISNREHPAYTYHASGAYAVAMTATNLYGSVTVSDVVEVYGLPRAGFVSSSPNELGQTTAFTDTSTGLPAISSYQWSFDDGATSTQQNPTHVFMTAGWHWVVLTATNAYGSDAFVGWVGIQRDGSELGLYLPLVIKSFSG